MTRQHPQLNVSTNKEPHYFSNNYDRGEEWYLQNWNSDDRPRGEFSTSYLYSEAAIRRMAGDCPAVRVIVMIRHPVDRAISHLKHVMRGGAYDDVESALDAHPEVVHNSRYAERVAALEEAFGPDQVCVEFFPDVKDAPGDLLTRVFSFLEVDSTFSPDGLDEVVGRGFEPRFPMLDRVRMAIYRTLKRSGFFALIQLVKRSGVTKLYKRLNDEGRESRGEKKELRSLLQKHTHLYRTDLCRLVQRPSVRGTGYVKEWMSSLENASP
jgi:hypothetical protein